MNGLAEFLKARLDEDEQAARDAGADTWTASDSGLYHEDASTQPGPFAVDGYGYLGAEGIHIARHDPARVLREVEAKRRIMALHTIRSGTGGDWDTDPAAICNECGGLYPCETLELLALPYADHPDYREEWRV